MFLYFGKLSYSIYMIHAAVLYLVLATCTVIQRILKIELIPTINEIRYIDLGNPIFNTILIFIVLGITILVSSFTYKFIEQKG